MTTGTLLHVWMATLLTIPKIRKNWHKVSLELLKLNKPEGVFPTDVTHMMSSGTAPQCGNGVLLIKFRY